MTCFGSTDCGGSTRKKRKKEKKQLRFDGTRCKSETETAEKLGFPSLSRLPSRSRFCCDPLAKSRSRDLMRAQVRGGKVRAAQIRRERSNPQIESRPKTRQKQVFS